MSTLTARMEPEEAQEILRAHQRALDGHHDNSVFLFWDGEEPVMHENNEAASAAPMRTPKMPGGGLRAS